MRRLENFGYQIRSWKFTCVVTTLSGSVWLNMWFPYMSDVHLLLMWLQSVRTYTYFMRIALWDVFIGSFCDILEAWMVILVCLWGWILYYSSWPIKMAGFWGAALAGNWIPVDQTWVHSMYKLFSGIAVVEAVCWGACDLGLSLEMLSTLWLAAIALCWLGVLVSVWTLVVTLH
jgi:hypothetical protein